MAPFLVALVTRIRFYGACYGASMSENSWCPILDRFRVELLIFQALGCYCTTGRPAVASRVVNSVTGPASPCRYCKFLSGVGLDILQAVAVLLGL